MSGKIFKSNKSVLKRAIIILMIALMLFSTVGCAGNSGKGGGKGVANTDDPRIVDLGGRVLNWYIFEYSEDHEKSYEQGLKRLERRREIEELFNCKINILSGPNDTTVQMIAREVLAGTNTVDIVDGTAPQFVCGPVSSGIYIDLAELGVFDFNDPKWHHQVNSTALNISGKQYAVYKKLEADEALTNNQVMYFNKRLIKNAGYSADDIYKWQEEKTWTWEKFEEVAAAVSKLSTASNPIWGVVDYDYLLYGSLLVSNDTNWLTLKDAVMTFTGGNDKALEATAFYKQLYDKKIMPYSSRDASLRQMFYDGKVGFMVDYVNRLRSDSTISEMKDEYGLVMPPKGPRCDGYRSYIQWFNSFWAIPTGVEDPVSVAKVIDYYCDPYYEDADRERVETATRETFVKDEGSLAVFKHIEQGDVFSPALMAGPVWENWVALLRDILDGKKTASVLAQEMKPGYDGTFKDMWGLAAN